MLSSKVPLALTKYSCQMNSWDEQENLRSPSFVKKSIQVFMSSRNRTVSRESVGRKEKLTFFSF